MIFTNDDYFNWLLEKVGVLHGEYENYSLLVQYLYSREYEYLIAMDSNRASGGLALRSLYADQAGVYLEDVKDGPCTVMEVLVSLAVHMNEYAGLEVKECFWEMVDNLGLMAYDDLSYSDVAVKKIIDVWLYRQFDENGYGSPFPFVDKSQGDARSIELWNQMHKYLVAKYPPGDWINVK